jgi:hypothetical protein
VYDVKHMTFAGLEFQNVRMNQASVRAGFPADVLLRLGTPQLFEQPLLLDFKQLKIGFVSRPFAARTFFMPCSFVFGIPFIELQLSNKSIRVLFDTGAGYSVVNTVHLEELGIDTTHRNVLPVTDANDTKITHEIISLSGLSCVGQTIPASEFILMDLSTIETALQTRIDVILGANTMLRAGWNWLIDASENSIGFIANGLDVKD